MQKAICLNAGIFGGRFVIRKQENSNDKERSIPISTFTKHAKNEWKPYSNYKALSNVD